MQNCLEQPADSAAAGNDAASAGPNLGQLRGYQGYPCHTCPTQTHQQQTLQEESPIHQSQVLQNMQQLLACNTQQHHRQHNEQPDPQQQALHSFNLPSQRVMQTQHHTITSSAPASSHPRNLAAQVLIPYQPAAGAGTGACSSRLSTVAIGQQQQAAGSFAATAMTAQLTSAAAQAWNWSVHDHLQGCEQCMMQLDYWYSEDLDAETGPAAAAAEAVEQVTATSAGGDTLAPAAAHPLFDAHDRQVSCSAQLNSSTARNPQSSRSIAFSTEASKGGLAPALPAVPAAAAAQTAGVLLPAVMPQPCCAALEHPFNVPGPGAAQNLSTASGVTSSAQLPGPSETSTTTAEEAGHRTYAVQHQAYAAQARAAAEEDRRAAGVPATKQAPATHSLPAAITKFGPNYAISAATAPVAAAATTEALQNGEVGCVKRSDALHNAVTTALDDASNRLSEATAASSTAAARAKHAVASAPGMAAAAGAAIAVTAPFCRQSIAEGVPGTHIAAAHAGSAAAQAAAAPAAEWLLKLMHSMLSSGDQMAVQSAVTLALGMAAGARKVSLAEPANMPPRVAAAALGPLVAPRHGFTASEPAKDRAADKQLQALGPKSAEAAAADMTFEMPCMTQTMPGAPHHPEQLQIECQHPQLQEAMADQGQPHSHLAQQTQHSTLDANDDLMVECLMNLWKHNEFWQLPPQWSQQQEQQQQQQYGMAATASAGQATSSRTWGQHHRLQQQQQHRHPEELMPAGPPTREQKRSKYEHHLSDPLDSPDTPHKRTKHSQNDDRQPANEQYAGTWQQQEQQVSLHMQNDCHAEALPTWGTMQTQEEVERPGCELVEQWNEYGTMQQLQRFSRPQQEQQQLAEVEPDKQQSEGTCWQQAFQCLGEQQQEDSSLPIYHTAWQQGVEEHQQCADEATATAPVKLAATAVVTAAAAADNDPASAFAAAMAVQVQAMSDSAAHADAVINHGVLELLQHQCHSPMLAIFLNDLMTRKKVITVMLGNISIPALLAGDCQFGMHLARLQCLSQVVSALMDMPTWQARHQLAVSLSTPVPLYLHAPALEVLAFCWSQEKVLTGLSAPSSTEAAASAAAGAGTAANSHQVLQAAGYASAAANDGAMHESLKRQMTGLSQLTLDVLAAACVARTRAAATGMHLSSDTDAASEDAAAGGGDSAAVASAAAGPALAAADQKGTRQRLAVELTAGLALLLLDWTAHDAWLRDHVQHVSKWRQQLQAHADGRNMTRLLRACQRQAATWKQVVAHGSSQQGMQLQQ